MKSSFWQLTVNAADPEQLARFWAAALGYVAAPPDDDTTWNAHYRARLDDRSGFTDRIFDPTGRRPPLWFQKPDAPTDEVGATPRLHVDIYPTGRDGTLSPQRRAEIIEGKVSELVALGGTVERGSDDPGDLWIVLRDPEGNVFCVS